MLDMKTREEIIRLLEGRRGLLRSRYGVRRLALFGSYARGEQREDSDVDILVEVDPAIGLDFVSLADELEELLGVHVELVSERAVNPRHLDRIRKDLIDVGSA